MYHIVICDEDSAFSDDLKRRMRPFAKELGIPVKITCFTNMRELYRALHTPETDIHLLFLSIAMGEKDDGMRLAVRLRKEKNHVSIVLVCASVEYVLLGYNVQAVKCLLKPVKAEELKTVLFYDYRNHFKKRYLGVETGTSICSLPFEEIDCFEIKGKKIAAYLRSSTYYYRGKFTDLESLLPGEFYRCHQSFIVNLDNVVLLERYSAKMKDGREVPVSQRLYSQTRQAYRQNLLTRLTVFESDAVQDR